VADELLQVVVKTCTKCGESKESSAFSPRAENGSGLKASCKLCINAARRAKYAADPAHRERHAANVLRYKAEAQERDYSAWSKTKRAYQVKYRYGITLEQYQILLDAQGGTCAIPSCSATVSDYRGQSLHIDHDHACCPGSKGCGKCIRGLLCFVHNHFVEPVAADLELVVHVLDYLQNPPARLALYSESVT
jgi:hypothetical protein